MAEGTVDNLNIQVSADAEKASRSLNNLANTLTKVNKSFAGMNTKNVSAFSANVNKLATSLKALNGIKVSIPSISGISRELNSLSKIDFSKLNSAGKPIRELSSALGSLRGMGDISVPKIGAKNINSIVSAINKLKDIDAKNLPYVADGLNKVSASFQTLSTLKFNDSGLNKTINALNRLIQVNLNNFNAEDFRKITESISVLGNMPDVSSGVNRFVSSLSRLANAGEKTGQSANDIFRLGQELRKAVKQFSAVGSINADVNMFVQSIARLASAGNKTSQTASGLSTLAKETLEFFKAMQNAPKVSENTIRMTQALAQLASAGGKVNTATNTVSNAFEKLSRAGTSTMNALKKASSGIVSALQRLTGAGKGVNSLSLSLGNLLKTAIGFNIGYGLLNFGKSMFTLGSDVTEVENVVDVAFGGMAQSAYDFAKTAKEQFGLSELMALRYSGTMMSVLNASGVAKREAAEMSTTLTGLAGDLASFYNISQDNAWEKIMSGMAGEIEPLRRLGINMSVANLEAYALSQGITKSWQSMTQAEQVMLRYNYLMQASAQQQGDFARTSLTWANQVRLLQLNIQQLAATLGQGLIAAVLPAVTALNKLFAVLQKVAVAVRNFFYVLTGYKPPSGGGFENEFAGIEDGASSLEDLGSAGSDAAGGIGDAAKAAEELKNATLGIDELNIISPNEPASTGGSGGSGGGGGAGGIGGGDIGFDDGLLDLGDTDPEKYISPWAERIRAAFLAEDWELLGEEIAWGMNKGLQKVYDVISWENVGPKITAFTTAFTETFNSFVNTFDFELLGRTIGTGINTVVNTLNQLIDGIDWKNLGRRFAVGFNGLVDEIDWFELGRLIGNKFMIAWDTLLGFVTTLDWGEVGRSLADGFNGMLSEISLGDIGTTIGTIVAGVIEMFREFFANVDWSEVADQIKEGLSNALKAASSGGKNDGILVGLFGIGALAGLTKIIAPVVTVVDKLSKALGGSGLAKSIGTALKGIGGKSGLSGAFTGIKTALSGISAPAVAATGAIAIISGGIIDLWNTSKTFRDSVSEMWDKIATAFSEAKMRIWDETLVPLGEQFSEFWKSIYDAYESSGLKNVFEQIVTFLGEQLASKISGFIKIVSNAFQTVGGIIGGILEVLTGVADFVSGVFAGDWNKAWSGVKNIVKGVVDAISSFFSGLWETITIIFSPVIEFFGNIFSSAYDKVTSAWQFITSWFGEKWTGIKNVFSDVKDWFKNAFKSAYDAVTEVWNGIGSFFKGIANSAIKPIGKLVNGIIDGINWVGDKLGVGKVLNNWSVPQFASGSKGIQKDTFGVVNDQKGATYKELILPPNGKPFIPKGRNVMLPLQKGTKIMPAGQTEELMKLMNIPRFAGGIGDFFGGAWSAIKSFAGDVWDYLTHPGDLVKVALDKFIKLGDFFEPWLTIAGGAINKLFDGIVEFVQGLFDKANPVVNYNPSAGVEQWRAVAAQALRMTGQYSESNLNLLLYQMQTESGGNPNAINNWDINAINGTPSKGLMQVIDPTFRAYAYPGYDKNIYDPLSNILAAIRYTLSRYGSLANGWKGHGYAEGIGKINLSDLFGKIPALAGGGTLMPGQLFVANERGPELIGRYGNRTTVMNNDQVVESVSSGVEKAIQRQNDETNALLRQILDYQQRLLAKDTSINLDGKRTDSLLRRARSNSGYNFRPAGGTV